MLAFYVLVNLCSNMPLSLRCTKWLNGEVQVADIREESHCFNSSRHNKVGKGFSYIGYIHLIPTFYNMLGNVSSPTHEYLEAFYSTHESF